MPYELTPDDRARFLAKFAPPFRWSVARQRHEELRFWFILREEPSRVLLRHGTGAVAEMRREGDMVVDLQLHEGSAAEPLLRMYAFFPSEEERALAKRLITSGKDLDAALYQTFGRTVGVVELLPETILGLQRRRFRVGVGGVLEVDVDGDGTIRGHRWHTGGAALDLMNAAVTERRWEVKQFPGNPVRVRSAQEAELFIAVQKGDPMERREVGGRLEVLAHIPEGRHRFVFELTPGAALPPSLDPADLVLFAARVEGELPAKPSEDTTPRRRARHAELLRLAAWGLREAIRFVPPGEELPPLGIYHTRAAEFLRMTRPERFRPAVLAAGAQRLEALAAQWVAW